MDLSGQIDKRPWGMEIIPQNDRHLFAENMQ